MAINSKPITDVIREAEDGRFVEDVTEEFNKLIDAVTETGKPGILTIQIGVEASGRKTIALHVKSTVKEPKANRIPTTFFLDKHGTLVRDDPDQPKLPLRSVDDNKPLREVAG